MRRQAVWFTSILASTGSAKSCRIGVAVLTFTSEQTICLVEFSLGCLVAVVFLTLWCAILAVPMECHPFQCRSCFSLFSIYLQSVCVFFVFVCIDSELQGFQPWLTNLRVCGCAFAKILLTRVSLSLYLFIPWRRTAPIRLHCSFSNSLKLARVKTSVMLALKLCVDLPSWIWAQPFIVCSADLVCLL